MTMIRCDLYIRHFYVLNSIIDVLRFSLYRNKWEEDKIMEASKILNNVSFESW